MQRPLLTSHSRMVPVLDPEASLELFVENAIYDSGPWPFVRAVICMPVRSKIGKRVRYLLRGQSEFKVRANVDLNNGLVDIMEMELVVVTVSP